MHWSIESVKSQAGRTAIITGANSGLGYSTALALAGKGCKVVLACRDLGKAQAAKAQILTQHPKAQVECATLDLMQLASVRAFAKTYLKSHTTLELLINNAGIMMPPYALSADGFESQFAANYLGHFALTGLLLPLLNKTPGARVVSLSSLAHNWGTIRFDDPSFERGYDKRAAYGQSKLACLMFAYELDRRLKAAGLGTLSVAAHPGVAATNLAQHFPKVVSWLFPLVGQPAASGALPTLYAALGNDIQGGDYCGPKNLHQMRGDPVKVSSNRASRDQVAAKRLWEMSQTWTKMKIAL